jgi:hypothetical protein
MIRKTAERSAGMLNERPTSLVADDGYQRVKGERFIRDVKPGDPSTAVILRESGGSSTLLLLREPRQPLEYWITRLRG